MLIIPANTLASGGFAVDNSCRFNVASSDSLTKSFGSAGNRAVWTWSAWIKVGGDAGFNGIFTAGDWTGGSTATGIILYNNQFYIYWNSPAGGTSPAAKFRDPSAWYHVVLTANTSTLKLYVNSVEYASKSISGSGEINNASSEQAIGKYSNGSSTFNGYMSEVCFIDGTAYAPTDFGKFDEDSGIWKPIDVSGLTFGTNGFYLDFKDSAALGDDVSGNGNDFTVNNLTAIDQTTDTPTNNFCTWNAIAAPYSAPTLSEGNTKVTNNAANWQGAIGTFGISQGKWYWEARFDNTTNTYNHGVIDESVNFAAVNPMNATGYTGFYNADGGEIKKDATDTTADYGTFGTNDIIGIALNMDDKQISIYKNGSVIVSNFALSTTSNLVFPCTVYYTSGICSYNFGNPSFAISSGNADGNGYGNFEYEVPSGYLALNTKNLSEILS